MTRQRSLGYLRHVCTCGFEWWAHPTTVRLERDRCWCGEVIPVPEVDDG
jgi:hypothetical protein